MPDGVYFGYMIDGKLHGTGTYLYSDGRKFTGKFKNNKMHGKGRMAYNDGRVEEGVWKDDVQVKK